MVSDNLVLIPGAGGVGRTIFEQLRTQQVPVRFMVRPSADGMATVKLALSADWPLWSTKQAQAAGLACAVCDYDLRQGRGAPAVRHPAAGTAQHPAPGVRAVLR
jgi:hypothetical protein